MNADRNQTPSAGQPQRPAQRPPQAGQARPQGVGPQRPQTGQPQTHQRPPVQGGGQPQRPTQRPTANGSATPRSTPQGHGGAPKPQHQQVQTTRKKRVNPRHLARLRATMLVVGSMILLLGLLLAILPLFKLQKIEISGIQYYTEEQILEHTGLTIGDEMLAIDLDATRDALLSNFNNIERVTVRSIFPGTVKIEIVEKSDVAYLWYEGEFYSFDSNFRVLEKSSHAERFDGFARVILPEIATLEVGEKIVFSNSDMDMGYVFSLVNEMKRAELLPYVTLLDCEQKYQNAIELNNNCRIEVGKISDIPSKLELAQQILVSKGLGEGQCVVLDVSDMKKSTYRLISQADFLTVGSQT